MAFASESEESEVGLSNVIFSKSSPVKKTDDSEKTISKSSAYWKSKNSRINHDKKEYCCMVQGCIAKFARPWRLHAHLAVHFGKKPYPCDVGDCDKAYTSIYHLRRHKASVHETTSTTITKRYKCEFEGCTVEFKTRQNAKKHFKRTHEGRTCKECGKIFNKRSQLVSHQFVHTGVAPFKCLTCHAGFSRRGELRRHERGHREHICPEKGCFLAFKSWAAVRKHRSTHPPKYVCMLCRKSYVCRKNLKEHILKHNDPNFTTKRKANLKTFECHICTAKLVGKASLERHIAVIHEGKPGQGRDPSLPPKIRATRKDKGTVKRAMAPKLAEIKVPFSVEKELLQRSNDNELIHEEIQQVILPHLKDFLECELNSCSSDESISGDLTNDPDN